MKTTFGRTFSSAVILLLMVMLIVGASFRLLVKDYLMDNTLEGLKKVCPVNPVFETTLKHNLVNFYCRQACYEAEKYLFRAEQEAYFGWVMDNVRAGNRADWEWTLEEKAKEPLPGMAATAEAVSWQPMAA